MGSTPVQVAADFISGKVDCGIAENRSNLATDLIDANLRIGCYVQDWAWGGLPTSTPVYKANALECQGLLSQDDSADNFMYLLATGSCSIFKSQSNVATALKDVISGRKHCSNTSAESIEVKDDASTPSVAIPSFGLQGGAIAISSCSLAIVAFMAFLLFMGAMPSLLFLVLAYLFLLQSPSYLAVHGDYEGAKAVLESMRRDNRADGVSVEFKALPGKRISTPMEAALRHLPR